MFHSFYRNKTVLVTGHTGFKGSWLSLWLRILDAKVCGLSLPPPTHPNLHEIIRQHAFTQDVECDIRDLSRLQKAVAEIRPEIVFPLAAQPLVRQSYLEPLE